MTIRGLRTLQKLGRWARARLVGGGLILLYHRVAEPAAQPAGDPFGLCVSPRHLAQHLEVLRKRRRVVSLQTLTRSLATGSPPHRVVAVSFDDGYLDNLEQAKPLLDRFEIPATYFVVAGALSGRFWWDELIDALFRPRTLPRHLELTADGRRRSWRVSSSAPSTRRRLLFALYGTLKPRSPESRRELVAQVAAWAGTRGEPGNGPRVVSTDELRQLATGGLSEIGSHGATHSPLADLRMEKRREEAVESRSRLEATIRRPVTSFSYPYGQEADLDESCAQLLAEAGYERACTNIVDVARAGGNPFLLPRYWVGDWSGEQFATRLRRWIGR